ncbi:MAG TPA: VOC family protein [Minicystis sp.]|nr:VOC family protein [Minicystis sp.]
MRIFRVMVEVDDLARATAFYAELLGVRVRDIPRASRTYFDCGDVILAVVDVSRAGEPPKPSATDLYFSVKDVGAVHARATALGALSTRDVHDAAAGEVVVRPWGERSFYAVDPWGNKLCFADETTLFTGR